MKKRDDSTFEQDCSSGDTGNKMVQTRVYCRGSVEGLVER